MAKRLMSTDVVDSDKFLSMSKESQLAYFHLNMHTNEIGFIEHLDRLGYLKISQKAIKELLQNGFILQIESNAFVITHWKKSNNLKYKPKECELAQKVYITKSGEYALKEEWHESKEDEEDTWECPFD